MMGMQSHAATDPYYADFTSSSLNVNYTYNGNSTGTFNAVSKVDPITGSLLYSSSTLSSGTHGAYNDTPFTGYYDLTANLADIGGSWQVTSGTVTIEGTLMGGTSSALLLTLDLKTGANNFVYGSSGSKLFDFFFTVDGNTSKSNAELLEDYFGAGTGAGEIDVNTSTYLHGYTGFTSNFSNTSSGTADTFVPEPAVYPLAASLAAMASFVFSRRANAKQKTGV